MSFIDIDRSLILVLLLLILITSAFQPLLLTSYIFCAYYGLKSHILSIKLISYLHFKRNDICKIAFKKKTDPCFAALMIILFRQSLHTQIRASSTPRTLFTKMVIHCFRYVDVVVVIQIQMMQSLSHNRYNTMTCHNSQMEKAARQTTLIICSGGLSSLRLRYRPSPFLRSTTYTATLTHIHINTTTYTCRSLSKQFIFASTKIMFYFLLRFYKVISLQIRENRRTARS